MNQERKIYELIRRYLKTVDQGTNLLRQYFDYDPRRREWWEVGLEQEGHFGPKHKYHYFFHGSGCRMKIEDVVIDWDYGYYGRYDGFNASKLSNFAKQIRGYEDFMSSGKVQAYLNSLKKQGLIENKQFMDQYYLV